MEITAQGLDTPGPAREEVVERASPRSTSSNREMYEVGDQAHTFISASGRTQEQRLILTVDPVDKDKMKDVSPMLSESASISLWWDQRGDLLAEPFLRSRKMSRSPNKEEPEMKIKMLEQTLNKTKSIEEENQTRKEAKEEVEKGTEAPRQESKKKKKDKSSPTIINTKEIEGVIMNKLKKRTEEMEKFISANKNVHVEIKRMAGEIKTLVRRAIEEQKIEEQRRFERPKLTAALFVTL
ncbi:hypothetical protein FQR65_LT09129 [Abscondita terminalis]|nr:hypothetical protein FQR65_LT09129 [Abscondita terminalis]